MAKRKQPLVIYEQVRRCRYCNSDMTDSVSARGYLENPFCTGCLDERLAKASAARGPGHWEQIDGGYMQWISDTPDQGTTHDDARE